MKTTIVETVTRGAADVRGHFPPRDKGRQHVCARGPDIRSEGQNQGGQDGAAMHDRGGMRVIVIKNMTRDPIDHDRKG